MTGLPELREAYRLQFGRYERLGEYVRARLEQGLSDAGVYQPDVVARPKDVVSFLKKAMRKAYADPLAEITDKAGVRVLVALLDDVPIVENVITELFEVREHVNKRDALIESNQLGYLGIHFLVTPRQGSLDSQHLDLEGAICEIQIHTRAQNAWSMVSHPLLYKPAGVPPSQLVARRINRLMALVELFDEEIAAARTVIMAEPGYGQAAMLQALEKEFLQLARQNYDPILSLEILEAISPAYSATELATFSALITEFVGNRRPYLEAVIRAAGEDSNPLLHQPEVIAILERLEHAKLKLRAVWDKTLPPAILDSLSEELGRPA